jgi:hypothetical protein
MDPRLLSGPAVPAEFAPASGAFRACLLVPGREH